MNKLSGVPGFKISVLPCAAGSEGMEQWLITIIATVANIATIADFLYNYFRRKKKKENATYEPVRLSADEWEKITLNNLTREELIKVIETRRTYRLARIIPHEAQKAKRYDKEQKIGAKKPKRKKKGIDG